MQLYLTMPKPGETIREGVIIQWLKKEGEFVDEKDPLVELETEKAVFTFESPFRGELSKIIVAAGVDTPVGNKIALFEVNEEDGAKYEMLGVGMVEDDGGREEERGKRVEGSLEKLDELPLSLGRGQGEGSVHSELLSPYLHKLIRENHLSEEEVSKIPHTGLEGRLSLQDVENYLENKKSSTASHFQSGVEKLIVDTPPLQKGDGGGFYDSVPLSPIRQRIAKHLSEAIQHIPQACTGLEVDFTEIQKIRKNNRELWMDKLGFSLSPFHFFSYALVQVLKKMPEWNAQLVGQMPQLKLNRYHSINLSFAVAAPQGLLTPVLPAIENLSLEALAQKMKTLEEKAKAGKLSSEDFQHATIIANNPGAIGGERSVQLLPGPMLAIVGMNKIVKKPIVLGEGIHIREMAQIDMTFDHRAMDGIEAILFVETLKEVLQNLQ